MRNVSIQVSKDFIQNKLHQQMSPVKFKPINGYQYNHHLVIDKIDTTQNILSGIVGTISLAEVFTDVLITLEGGHQEIAKIII